MKLCRLYNQRKTSTRSPFSFFNCVQKSNPMKVTFRKLLFISQTQLVDFCNNLDNFFFKKINQNTTQIK